jgi:hypothetical protein
MGITFSTGLHSLAEGCHEPGCYWTDLFNNVAAGDLSPDIAIATSFADYASGLDPVLAAVIAANR